MVNKDYKNKRFPIEHLVFKIENPNSVEKFIEIDHEIWTKYLSSFDSFISKEIWVNENNPGEVHTIVIWETMDGWKSIPVDELKACDEKFKKQFGEKFEIIRRIHKEYEHGLYKVRHFEKEKGL